VSTYIPGVVRLNMIPGDVAMKCTLRHASHMMPIWIGMGGDYGTIGCPEAYARSCEEAAHP
jgi:hypothetical protein